MIEIRHLRYFVAVAEELNFRRAAERVHIDQTPLARAVRDLEHEMGVRLLVRGPRSLQLTPAGEKLLTGVKRLSIRLEGTKRAVRRTHLLYKEPLRIGVADDIAQPKLSECIRHWRAKFPDVALDVTEMRACELVSALKSENVDVGFSFGIPNDESIVQIPAWHYRLMAALPSGHELADRPVVSLSDVLAFPLLFWNEERFPGLVSQMRGIAERYTRDLSIVAEARTMPGFAIRVASGAVPGLIDGGHVLAFPPSFTQIRPLDCDENVTTFALYKARRVAPSESAQNFLTHIEHLS